jgi:succinate dehydrogenase / fumarate reductase, cytochrome b subunit
VRAAAPAWLRWHAFLGAVPLAGYVLLHLIGQALALRGGLPLPPEPSLLGRSQLLRWLEVILVYAPLCAHALLGLWRWRQPEAAPSAAAWPAAWGRSLQRGSAGVLLLFLLFHVWQFEGRLWLGELRQEDFLPELCASLSSTRFGGVPLVALGYLLGMGAVAVHAAQGWYHACLSSGLVSQARRERLGQVCLIGGIAVFAAGALIVVQLATGSLWLRLSLVAAAALASA